MNVVIAAGGTGGHLYPAIAVAREFLKRDPSTRILFVGTTRGIERKVLAHEGFPLQCIDANPLMGKSLLEILKGPSMSNGYYAVRYADLCLRMTTLDAWNRSGIAAVTVSSAP